MRLKGIRALWGWGVRVDKDGNLRDSFVQEPRRDQRYKTKWRVKPRGRRRLRLATLGK